jgi:hypothetical protein
MISQRSGNIGSNSSTGVNTGGNSSTGVNTRGNSGTGANTGGNSGTGANTGGNSGTGANTGGNSGTGANTGGNSGTGANTGGNSGTGANTGGNSGTGDDDDGGGNAIPSLSGTQTNFTSGYPPLVTDPHAQTAVALGYPAPCGTANNVHTSQNGVITGFLAYTIYNGTTQPNTTISNVKRVAFRYDGKKFTLAASMPLATTTGADGIVTLPSGNIVVGSEGHQTFLLNPQPGPAKVAPIPNTIISDHVVYDSVRNVIWTSGYASVGSSSGLVEIPLKTFSHAVLRKLKGGDSRITMIAFDSSHNAYYTNSNPQGFGSVGSVNLETFTTVRKIRNLPAAHGIAFDHFTNTLILVGSNHITQIDPKTFSIVSDWKAPPEHSALQIDQVAVDGRGHLWATSHDGNLVFIDYSRTRKVANPANYVHFNFIEIKLDDIALLCRS